MGALGGAAGADAVLASTVAIGATASGTAGTGGALIVGLIRAFSILLYPELEVLAIYLIVVGVTGLIHH